MSFGAYFQELTLLRPNGPITTKAGLSSSRHSLQVQCHGEQDDKISSPVSDPSTCFDCRRRRLLVPLCLKYREPLSGGWDRAEQPYARPHSQMGLRQASVEFWWSDTTIWLCNRRRKNVDVAAQPTEKAQALYVHQGVSSRSWSKPSPQNCRPL